MTVTTYSLRTGLSRIRQIGQRYGAPLWIILLTACAAVFFLQGRSDFARAIDTISGTSPLWIVLIVISQTAILAIAAATYRIILRHIGSSVRISRLFALHMERKLIGTLVPAGGPASVYVFVRGLGRERVSSDDALFTLGVRSLMGFASFISFLLPAILLARPEGVLLAGALTLLCSFVLVVGLIALLLQRPDTTRGLERRIPERIVDMLTRIRSHRIGLRELITPYLLALIAQLANVTTLAAALYALGYSPSIVSILAGYTVGTAAVTLAPAFQGIGLVEVSMAVTLQQFGVPPSIAIAATLLFRGGTVWFPLLLGTIFHAGRWIPTPETSWPTGWLPRRFAGTSPVMYFSSGIMAAIVAAAFLIIL